MKKQQQQKTIIIIVWAIIRCYMQSIVLWLEGVDIYMQGKYSHARLDCRNEDPDGIVFVLIPIYKSRGWPWLYAIDATCATGERERAWQQMLIDHYWSRLSLVSWSIGKAGKWRIKSKQLYNNDCWLSFFLPHTYIHIIKDVSHFRDIYI
jgi:hypothetical protein